MPFRLHELQKEAHSLAGRPFSLSSPDEICQVLYKELGLPVNGEPGRRWTGRSRGKSSSNNNNNAPSSNKEALIRLKSRHPLPAVILDWRKLRMAVSNTVYPMQRARKAHPWMGKDRIYTSCYTLTATGRVTLREPNIQSIPR